MSPVNQSNLLKGDHPATKETDKLTFIEGLAGRCTRLVERIKTSFDNFILEVFSAIGAFFKMITSICSGGGVERKFLDD
jgi:hypothetical protein